MAAVGSRDIDLRTNRVLFGGVTPSARVLVTGRHSAGGMALQTASMTEIVPVRGSKLAGVVSGRGRQPAPSTRVVFCTCDVISRQLTARHSDGWTSTEIVMNAAHL